MNAEQAIKFITIINMMGPHLPPILMQALAGCDILRVIESLANGKVTCSINPVQVAVSTPEEAKVE